MPLFDDDETRSTDIFEQQRRRTKINKAVDSNGTNYPQTGSQSGPTGFKNGPLSQGKFKSSIGPTPKPKKSAYAFKEAARLDRDTLTFKPRQTFQTSTGSVQSSRDKSTGPRTFKRNVQAVSHRTGQQGTFDSTLNVGTGNRKTTYGFRTPRETARAQNMVAERNKRVAAIRAKAKSDGIDLKETNMTNNNGLSFGEKLMQEAGTKMESGQKAEGLGRQVFFSGGLGTPNRTVGRSIGKDARKRGRSKEETLRDVQGTQDTLRMLKVAGGGALAVNGGMIGSALGRTKAGKIAGSAGGALGLGAAGAAIGNAVGKFSTRRTKKGVEDAFGKKEQDSFGSMVIDQARHGN